MMALGDTDRDIFKLILAENAMIGVAGALAGTIIGIGLAVAISAVGIPMPPPPNSDLGYTAHILIVPAVIVGAFVVGLLATLVGCTLARGKGSQNSGGRCVASKRLIDAICFYGLFKRPNPIK